MRHIYTVSELNGKLKKLLEEQYPFIWITGEISNFSLPASGHSYFSLKDNNSLINCVMFKNQRKRLKFAPESGMKITGMGRLSLYEPRGSYQLILEHLEPEGAGALQIAFEQLKRKLAKEGLFDEGLKKPIPFFPLKISVITSGTGAAVKDVINVSKRRFPGISLEIVPVKVQGSEAEHEIANALAMVNSMENSDLIILCRGGGSLEDLAAFNSEKVARAVYDSVIPVISAVGHETDFTIADFAADLRAPTPSAAAELAVPDVKALKENILALEKAMLNGFQHYFAFLKNQVNDLESRLKSPAGIIDDMRFRLEDIDTRCRVSMEKLIFSHKEKLQWFDKSLYANNPGKNISILKKECDNFISRLKTGMTGIIKRCRAEHDKLNAGLTALSPEAVLERGYSITRQYPEKIVLLDSDMTATGNIIEVILAKGKLLCQVKKRNGKEKNI